MINILQIIKKILLSWIDFLKVFKSNSGWLNFKKMLRTLWWEATVARFYIQKILLAQKKVLKNVKRKHLKLLFVHQRENHIYQMMIAKVHLKHFVHLSIKSSTLIHYKLINSNNRFLQRKYWRMLLKVYLYHHRAIKIL